MQGVGVIKSLPIKIFFRARSRNNDINHGMRKKCVRSQDHTATAGAKAEGC